MADAPRFLLVRLDGLGDALACIPALEGLRSAHPGAAFGAICSPANATLFSSRMQHVHVLDAAAHAGALAPDLRAIGYTHALVATEEVVGYALARASGAQRRSGFWHRFEKPFKSLWQYAQLTDAVYRPAAWTARPEHESLALYRLALPFGARSPAPDDSRCLREWLAIEAEDEARTTHDALGFQIVGKLTAGGWGPGALAALCGATLRAAQMRVLTLLAAPADQGLAQSVLEQLDEDVRARATLVPAASLPRWLHDLDSLAALVTPDTGAAHAAGMLGVPVIDLFAEERFEQLSRQWRPWAAPARCIIKPAAAPGVPERFGQQIGAQIPSLRARDPRTHTARR